MSKQNTAELPVAIVGGGFSGTLLALNLLRLGARVALIERNEDRMAKGLAFGTRCPDHLLNVRAANMSAYQDDPSDFLQWMGLNNRDLANRFVPRLTYGNYLRDQLLSALGSAPDRIRVLAEEATGVCDDGRSVALTLLGGGTLEARAVVLALGNLPPAPFPPFADLPGTAYCADPWDRCAADKHEAIDHVLLLGTGLTAVDLILALDAGGYRGQFTALSRRRLAPRSHAKFGPSVIHKGSPEARGSWLVRHVRNTAREVGWRAAVDELRPHTQNLWRRHDEAGQRRFLRHLRPWWDVHRHRIAPQVADRIAALQDAGRLAFVAGKVSAAWMDGDHVAVGLRRRGKVTEDRLTVGRVINCTGAGGDITRATQPLLLGLQATGRIRPDVHHLGLDVDQSCRVRDATGTPQERLFAVGPVTKGEAWEIIAVPDIRRQVWDLARVLTASHWIGGEGL